MGVRSWARTAKTLDRVARADMAEGLRSVGLARGPVVLRHSSLSRVGFVEGGGEAVVDALLEVVGLLVPRMREDPELMVARRVEPVV